MANFGSQTSPKIPKNFLGVLKVTYNIDVKMLRKKGIFLKNTLLHPKIAPFPIVYWDELKMN